MIRVETQYLNWRRNSQRFSEVLLIFLLKKPKKSKCGLSCVAHIMLWSSDKEFLKCF